jgi:hypothetical protein
MVETWNFVCKKKSTGEVGAGVGEICTYVHVEPVISVKGKICLTCFRW